MTERQEFLLETGEYTDLTWEAEYLRSGPKIELFGEDVYTPRPFSYLLAAWAVRRAQQLNAGAKVLDVGTGTGVVAITIKKAIENIEIFASDISDAALRVTQQNACANDVEIPVIKMDLVQRGQCYDLDMITMHPPAVPHVDENSWGFSEGMALATNGGRDGAVNAVGIVQRAAECLKANGELLLLVPHWCAHARVMKELDAAFLQVKVLDTKPANFFPLVEGRPTPETLSNLWALKQRGEIEVDPISAASKASVVWAACPRKSR